MKAHQWTAELRDGLRTAAAEAGFETAGVADVLAPDDAGAVADSVRFAAWVGAGYAAEMQYLTRRNERGELLRGVLQRTVPWARSVVVCAWNYNAEGPRSIDPSPDGTGWMARYTWMGATNASGGTAPADYHDLLLCRLHRVQQWLNTQADCETRCYVDTGPILERDFAAKAGVGWIGKNTCVLNQELGSWLLLGVIVTSLPGEGAFLQLPAADRCGTCTRCIDACPTDALLAARDPNSRREMDASRCISYLTIEKKGAIAEELRHGVGRNVFGCDICQEVCPWNGRAPRASEEVQARKELMNPALAWLAQMDNAEFKHRFKGSPLERTGRKRLLRNVAMSMGNSGAEEHLEQLDAWAGMEVKGAADEALREAAEWARTKIRALHEAREVEDTSASLRENVDPCFQPARH